MEQQEVREHYWALAGRIMTAIWAEAENLNNGDGGTTATCTALGPDGSVHPTAIILLWRQIDESTAWNVEIGFSNASSHDAAINWKDPGGFPLQRLPLVAHWLGKDRWGVRDEDRWTLPPLVLSETAIAWNHLHWDDIDAFDGAEFVGALVAATLDHDTAVAARADLDRQVTTRSVPPEGPPLVRTVFDVGLSFAGEQRPFVEKVATVLREQGVSVYYDRFVPDELWGKNLLDEFAEVFSTRCRYVVMFISRDYVAKNWPNHERQAAQAKAMRQRREYILPVRFDDTEVPGMPDTIGYVDAETHPPEKVADLVIGKLEAGTS